MTIQQIHLFNALFLAILVVVAVLTRAKAWRTAGALAGLLSSGIAAVGERSTKCYTRRRRELSG